MNNSVLKKGEPLGMTVLDLEEREDIRVKPDGKMVKEKIRKFSKPKVLGGA